MSSACPNPTETRGVIERDGFTAPDGREIVLWRWPQSDGRPTLHWAHATGFHGRLYRPMLDELAGDCNVLAWDMRGHGDSANAGRLSSFQGWPTYYRDLTAFLDRCPAPVWLGGHSIGATASLMAAARRPHKVHGLLLAEPVLLDWRFRWLLRGLRLLRQTHRLPHAAGAAARRARFNDKTEALAAYSGRGGFKTWPKEWIAAYVEHGFIEHGKGGVQLACEPEWESATFATTDPSPWSGIQGLHCPVIALAAERASTFPQAAHRRMRRILPSAKVTTVPGTTHFLPMERPDAILAAARRLFDGVGPYGQP